MRNNKTVCNRMWQYAKRHGGLLLGMAVLSGVTLAAEREVVDSPITSMLSSPGSRHTTPATPASSAHTEPEQPGASERWLRLQASGAAASRHKQSATPVEQELANQRFLDSYQYAIPESFVEEDSGSIGAAGSGQGR